MSVAVVIPAYQAERFLGDTIRSVVRQDEKEIQIIIVDDGSTDRTSAIAAQAAKEDPRVEIVSQPNRGLAAARNAGHAHSNPNCDFVLFLDADDILPPDALRALIAFAQSHPESSAVYGSVEFINEDGAPRSRPPLDTTRRCIDEYGRLRTACADEPTTVEMLAVGNPIISAGQVLIRQDALRRIGGFDGSISALADADLWYRLARGTPGLPQCGRTTLRYRIHTMSMSHNRTLMRRDTLRMHLKRFTTPADAKERRMLLATCRAFFRHDLTAKWRQTVDDLRSGAIHRASTDLVQLLYLFSRIATPPTLGIQLKLAALRLSGFRWWTRK